MLRLLTFLVVAAALAFVAVWFANNPGTVQVEFLGRTLQTSVGILLLAFLAIGTVMTVLIGLLRGLVALPSRAGRSRRRTNEVRGYEALTRGFVEAAAGNLGTARALQQEAERLLPERSPVLLLAAQNAQLDGREEVAHLKFRRMLDSPETELLGLRGLLAQTMRGGGGDRDEALALARRAYRRSPTTPWVLTTLYDLLTRAERWEEALNLTAEMRAQKLVTDDKAQRQRGLLRHLVATRLRDDNQPQPALVQARRAVREAPEFTPAAVLAADLARQQGQNRRARRLLEDAWSAAPHPEVFRGYAGLVEGETPEKRLDRVEGRLKTLRPDHPELHVAVGELAIAAGRFDRARAELERTLALEPTQRVYRLLAELERAEGGAGAETRARDWLNRAADARPDMTWVCEDTGEVVPFWRPFGDSGRFDVVRWAAPPRLAPMLGHDVRASYTAVVEDEPAAAPLANGGGQTRDDEVVQATTGDGDGTETAKGRRRDEDRPVTAGPTPPPSPSSATAASPGATPVPSEAVAPT